VIESLLLTVTRVTTMFGQKHLSNATGFFFERDDRLFLVTNRHVVLDEASDHRPDRLEIELHVAPENVAMTTQFSIPLYRNQRSVWREGCDSTGPIDVVVLELERAALPTTLLFQTFTPAHLVEKLDQIEVGTSVRSRLKSEPRSGGARCSRPPCATAHRPEGPSAEISPCERGSTQKNAVDL
jgi:hypothetical protein